MTVAVSDPLSDDDPGQLQIVVSQHGTTITIAVAGEWDLAARMATREAIHAALTRRREGVVLDLSQLTFMETTGIHAALELHELAAHQNTQLEIIPGSRAVQRPFEMCQLIDVLPFRSVA